MISNIFRRQSLIAILCTISLLACYFVVPPAAAAGSVTLTIDTVPAAAEGTIVTIPITASEVGDIVSFGLKIDYNRTKLEFAGWDETGTTLESIWNLAVTKSTLANVNASSLKPAVAYVNGELSDISTVFEKSGTGILAKIKFKVLAAGANNTIPVSLSPGDTTVDDVSSPKTVTLKDGGLLAADTLSPQFTADYPKPGNPQSDGSRQVRLLIDVLEDVEYYYVVLPDGVGDTNPPTASQIIEKNYDGAIQYKNGSVTVRDGLDLDTASILPDHNTAYDFWIVIADDAGNASVPVKLVLATPPAADLFVAGYPKQGAEQDPGSNQIEILVETQNTEGNAIVHYVAVLAGEGAPTIDQIGAGKDSADNDALLKGNIIIPKVNTDETKILLTLLEAGTDYDIYMVAGDAVWAYPSLGTCSEKVKLKVTTPRAIGTDASVKGVIVDGAAATVDAANPAVYAVELPYGTVLSALTAAKVVITTTDSYATVATPTTTDGGATWTVLVTAEDGTTTKTYTINITVASPPIPPAYASTNALANPTVEVANATTETAAKAALDSTVGVLGTLGENGTATISWSIADYNPTAAGDYTATGVLTLPVAWTGSAPNLTATVTVLAPIPPAYASTNALANPTVEVANATTETAAKAALDSTVGVLGTLGENGTATISWSIADYNPTAAGDYTATGVLTLPVAWTGSAPNLTATVTVLAPDASDDATVTGVTVDGAAATVDAADPTVYDVELPYGSVLADLTAADVVVTATDSNATVATPTTTDGGATWTVLVTAEDGTTTKTYTINITVASPPIPPAYASTNALANPTVEVANATTETAAKAALDSTVGVLGTLGENGTATISWSIADYNPTAAGDYTATGVLTLPVAWTGSAPNLTATVTVLAPDASDDATVTGVTVDGAAATVDAADPTVYDVELPYGSVLADLTAADVVVTATDSNATVATPTTTDGGATWTVEVTAQDGTTTETYTINVTVASMMPATIADLTISKGTLRPAFDPDTYYYRASVANSVTSVTIAADELEDMVVSGDIGTFNLAVGDNTFEIYVDGGATHVDAAYTIVITRARGSSDGRDNSDMVITKNGGSVGQQGVSIQFPEGAVDEKIIVTIADVSTKGLTIPEGSRLVSDIFKINSDYDEDLDEDITIRLPFDLNEVDKSDDGLGLYRWDGDTWVILDNIAVNWSTGTIKGDADQFGKFAVLATALTPPVTPVTPLWDIVGHWAESAIRSLVTSEAISGYPDGTFRPDNTISRAEFASIIVKAFNIPTDSSKLFADTAGHWAQEAIASAYAAGIIAGYDDMSFGPDDPITREQMAVMIVKAKGLVPDGSTLSFNDQNSISPWASESVAAAAANQLISGYPDNTFRGGNFATRAEAVMVITQALK